MIRVNLPKSIPSTRGVISARGVMRVAEIESRAAQAPSDLMNAVAKYALKTGQDAAELEATLDASKVNLRDENGNLGPMPVGDQKTVYGNRYNAEMEGFFAAQTAIDVRARLLEMSLDKKYRHHPAQFLAAGKAFIQTTVDNGPPKIAAAVSIGAEDILFQFHRKLDTAKAERDHVAAVNTSKTLLGELQNDIVSYFGTGREASREALNAMLAHEGALEIGLQNGTWDQSFVVEKQRLLKLQTVSATAFRETDLLVPAEASKYINALRTGPDSKDGKIYWREAWNDLSQDERFKLANTLNPLIKDRRAAVTAAHTAKQFANNQLFNLYKTAALQHIRVYGTAVPKELVNKILVLSGELDDPSVGERIVTDLDSMVRQRQARDLETDIFGFLRDKYGQIPEGTAVMTPAEMSELTRDMSDEESIAFINANEKMRGLVKGLYAPQSRATIRMTQALIDGAAGNEVLLPQSNANAAALQAYIDLAFGPNALSLDNSAANVATILGPMLETGVIPTDVIQSLRLEALAEEFDGQRLGTGLKIYDLLKNSDARFSIKGALGDKVEAFWEQIHAEAETDGTHSLVTVARLSQAHNIKGEMSAAEANFAALGDDNTSRNKKLLSLGRRSIQALNPVGFWKRLKSGQDRPDIPAAMQADWQKRFLDIRGMFLDGDAGDSAAAFTAARDIARDKGWKLSRFSRSMSGLGLKGFNYAMHTPEEHYHVRGDDNMDWIESAVGKIIKKDMDPDLLPRSGNIDGLWKLVWSHDSRQGKPVYEVYYFDGQAYQRAFKKNNKPVRVDLTATYKARIAQTLHPDVRKMNAAAALWDVRTSVAANSFDLSAAEEWLELTFDIDPGATALPWWQMQLGMGSLRNNSRPDPRSGTIAGSATVPITPLD